MGKLPTQLQWRKFVAVLKALGYEQMKSGQGSARNFYNPNRHPHVVTFHEPHKGDNIRQGTLSEYLRKLLLDRDEFSRILDEC